MAHAERSPTEDHLRTRLATRGSLTAGTAALADQRPMAIAQRALVEGIAGSARAAAQRQQLERLFGNPGSAGQRQLQAAPPAGRVVQAEKKTVDGIEVDTDGGYTSWDGWHINWKLGTTKNGHAQYHLTSQDRTQHYFFIIVGDELEDTKPPARFVPKRGTHGGISKAPAAVQSFIRNNIRDLMP